MNPVRAQAKTAWQPAHRRLGSPHQIQLSWRRGGNAQNHLAHPNGDDNVRANETDGTWLRVVTALAGDNGQTPLCLSPEGERLYQNHK